MNTNQEALLLVVLIATAIGLNVLADKKKREKERHQREADRMIAELLWKVNHKTPMVIYL